MTIKQLTVIIISVIAGCITAQSNSLFSSENRLQFADHLYSNADYLRAALEYQSVAHTTGNDSLLLLTGECYEHLGNYTKAGKLYLSLINKNRFSDYAMLKYFVTTYKRNNATVLKNEFNRIEYYNTAYTNNINKLKAVTDLLTTPERPYTFNKSIFSNNEKSSLFSIVENYNNKPEKNAAFAAVLSTLVPGMGKVYTENYTDGLTAFLAVSVLGYIAYKDFEAERNTKGAVFAGLAGWMYASNIYGSYTSANIYNAKVKFEFNTELNSFVKLYNYFLPE